MQKFPVFFHPDQIFHKPSYEWRFGERIEHPETTSRAESILSAICSEPDLFEVCCPDVIPEYHLLKVHSSDLVTLYKTASQLSGDENFYPSVFPPRNRTKVNPLDIRNAGYFCFDSGTPLTNTTYMASVWSASCAFRLAQNIQQNKIQAGYALCRPPGHHASRSLFGGYCYFNNAAIAARYLSSYGKVAILDIDFHHGNGTQRIFYENPAVLFVSLHGSPREFYPYYEGYSSEMGYGTAEGYNINIELEGGTNYTLYKAILANQVIPVLHSFQPDYLIISAGFDTAEDDPVGTFQFGPQDYYDLGFNFSMLPWPTLVIQEGGYNSDTLGFNVLCFLKGLIEA